MAQKVSMFSGHSGVEKSTLLNTLSPGLDLKTANVSAQHEQGQHTTTFAEMYDLEGGAKIIDTPGIKGFECGHRKGRIVRLFCRIFCPKNGL